ncbi:hypothetical protein ACP4OV_002935 [Aristida adscensionis]
MVAQQAASVLQSFPFRAAVLALCVALLPLLPSQAPEAPAAGAGQAFLAKAWELLHLLVVGIAVSYGLFSRRIDGAAHDGGRGGGAEKDAAAAHAKPADARYVSRMFRDSLAPFDDDDDEVLPESPGRGEDEGGGGKVRSWSALHRPGEPVVVVSNGGGGRNGHTGDGQAPLSLPVRALKPQPAQDASSAGGGGGGGETRARPRRGSHDTGSGGREETVLPSPIPWRSRSGRFDAGRPASPSHQPSPKRLSPASSSSRETLAKASEEYYGKRRSPYRSSSTSGPPPAPPPPPPPFLVHGYHPAAERRTAAKSFKEELQDHSIRGRGGDHYVQGSNNFGVSAYSSSNSTLANPRNSFDGGSPPPAPVPRSVRTFRAREAAVFQGQSQELPDDAGDERDGVGVHGSEEPYGYQAYQSIPRFQYERSVTDPILGGVAVSSDDTESSDDDDGGAYSTRTNSPRESTPEVDENEVDKKAEEFIARFREQIRLQRIESIKRSAGPRGVKHGK